jgi:hypothetical protein
MLISFAFLHAIISKCILNITLIYIGTDYTLVTRPDDKISSQNCSYLASLGINNNLKLSLFCNLALRVRLSLYFAIVASVFAIYSAVTNANVNRALPIEL